MKKIYRRTLAATAMVLLASGTPLLASETDQRIESSFKESYAFKTFLQDDAVKVVSKDGVVTLSGTVNEGSERGLAQETAANLPGVKSVDNRLELRAGYPLERSNEWLAIDIKTALLFHRNVSMPNTQVYVEEGIVTLRGEAADETQKELTAEYANIDGVREVKNEMTVAKVPKKAGPTAQEKIDDASITAQVKMTLRTHRATRVLKIKVETKDGVVTLSGKTAEGAEKDLASKLVSDIYGVSRVIDHMTRDPFLTPNVYDNPFFATASRHKGDKASLEKIKIQYLIETVRRSPLTFTRNNKTYGGADAADHLSWKYSFAGERVKTAQEFIEKIASQSIQTGNNYLVRTSKGKTYPLRDVLYNDLERLEQSLG